MLRLALVVGFLGGTSSLFAQAGAYVPPIGTPMPLYFTSTNSRAFGEAYVYPPPPGGSTAPSFEWAELWAGSGLNWLLLARWDNPQTDSTFPHVPLAAMFDSSYFAMQYPQTTLEIRIIAQDNYGRSYSDAAVAPLLNKALCFEHPSFWWTWGAHGAEVASNRLMAMGYYSAGPIEGGWSEVTFTNSLRVPIIYVNSHGNANSIYSALTDPEAGGTHLIHAQGFTSSDTVQGARNYWNGSSGIPPFNSAPTFHPDFGPQPPINITFLETCHGGVSGAFSTFLIPAANWYTSPFIENQAVHAYTLYTDAATSEKMISVLLDTLEEGYSISIARLDLLDSGVGNCRFGEDDEWRPLTLQSDSAVQGDYYTRLKSVYTIATHEPIGLAREL